VEHAVLLEFRKGSGDPIYWKVMGRHMSAWTVVCSVGLVAVSVACVGDAPVVVSDPGTAPSTPSSSTTDAGAPCDGTLTRCGDTCVDLRSDEAHCGSCTKACAADATCAAGACVPPVATVASVDETTEQTYGVAVDAERIYFTTWPLCTTSPSNCAEEFKLGRVYSKSKADLGASARIIADRQAMPSRVVLEADRLIWGSWFTGGGIRSVKIASAGLGPVLDLSTSSGAYGLASRDGVAYVSRFSSDETADVVAVRVDGPGDAGDALSVVAGGGAGLGGPSIRGVATDSTRLYWTYASGVRSLVLGDRVATTADATAKIRNHVSGLVLGDGIAVDDTHVYFADRGRGTVGRVRKDDTTGAVEDVATGLGATRAILRDGPWLFVAAFGQGKIYRVTIAPGFPKVVLADSIVDPHEVAVDDTFVYFTGSSRVGRAPKDR